MAKGSKTLTDRLLAALAALNLPLYLPGESSVDATDPNHWFYWGPEGQPMTGNEATQGPLRKTVFGKGNGATTLTTSFVEPSTVLGLPAPLPWKTTITGGPGDGYARSYATPGAARLGHDKISAVLADLLGVAGTEVV